MPSKSSSHRGDHRCPVCGGADGDKRGQGKRCFGWTTAEGWTHCSRTQSRWPDRSGDTWAHPPAAGRAHAGCSLAAVAPNEREVKSKRDWLARVYLETLPLTDPAAEPARLYLARRGLAVVNAPALRFHRGLKYVDGATMLGWLPALVAKVSAPDGSMINLHRTYLQSDGQKAPVPCPKKLMSPAIPGSTTGGAIRLSAQAGPRLAIAEGIESAIAFTQLTGLASWATGSACGMRAIVLPAGIVEVAIAADNDTVGLEAARVLARRLLHEGRKVKIFAPPQPGADWNDVLLEGTLT